MFDAQIPEIFSSGRRGRVFFAAIARGCSQAESDMWSNGRGWLAYSSFLKHINLFLIHVFNIEN